tara:strand:+ start:1186 stop:1431 length:246 start_codon:yes stop_codon:yes gene_type:complete
VEAAAAAGEKRDARLSEGGGGAGVAAVPGVAAASSAWAGGAATHLHARLEVLRLREILEAARLASAAAWGSGEVARVAALA